MRSSLITNMFSSQINNYFDPSHWATAYNKAHGSVVLPEALMGSEG